MSLCRIAPCRTSFTWITLNTCVILVTLPVPQRLIIALLTLFELAYYSAYLTTIEYDASHLYHQHFLASLLNLFTVLLLALCAYAQTAFKHSRSFTEASESLTMKMEIEEQSAEQERLLLSVLPEHVAVQMRQDLGAQDSEQFKKIYMSRHENVR